MKLTKKIVIGAAAKLDQQEMNKLSGGSQQRKTPFTTGYAWCGT